MKVLVVGGGGREHALTWRLGQSPRVSKLYVAPGNPGTAAEPKTENVPVAAHDVPALLEFAHRNTVDLTVVGPETALVAGITDAFQAAGLACFGPTRLAARLEGSKAFAKAFMSRYGIPTAAYGAFDDLRAALDFIEGAPVPMVVKADGLAAGKGVFIASDRRSAAQAVTAIMSGTAFGAANRSVVIEEFLHGEEASFIVMADGRRALPLATSQDHKARDDGDGGPNTGGMGAYSPAPVITPEVHRRVMREVIEPTISGMAAEGMPYTGFLYAGLMIDAAGNPKVLEFNCRLGDPEAQVLAMRLKSDLALLCDAALAGHLDRQRLEWEAGAALGVIMAAGGYPEQYRSGDTIQGLPQHPGAGVKVFHAGTASKGGHIVTAGGRVLCVCAVGDNVRQAQARAYEVVGQIHWPQVHYRSDIGHRAVAREAVPPAR